MPTPTSLYDSVRTAQLQRYSSAITGSTTASVCAVSENDIGAEAKSALAAAFARLGYDARQIAFVSLDVLRLEEGRPLCGNGVAAAHDDASSEASNSAGSDAKERGDALFTVLETLDPLCVVLCDHASTETASRGYNQPLPLETRTLLLGRPCLCFEDFASLLEDDAGKRKAWETLKTLPAR